MEKIKNIHLKSYLFTGNGKGVLDIIVISFQYDSEDDKNYHKISVVCKYVENNLKLIEDLSFIDENLDVIDISDINSQALGMVYNRIHKRKLTLCDKLENEIQKYLRSIKIKTIFA